MSGARQERAERRAARAGMRPLSFMTARVGSSGGVMESQQAKCPECGCDGSCKVPAEPVTVHVSVNLDGKQMSEAIERAGLRYGRRNRGFGAA